MSDEDGVFRRAPLLQSYDGALYESLAMAVAQAYLLRAQDHRLFYEAWKAGRKPEFEGR